MMQKDDFVYDKDLLSSTGVVLEMFDDGTAWVFWHKGHFKSVEPTKNLCVLSKQEFMDYPR